MSSTLDPHILIPGAWMKPRLKARICAVLARELAAYVSAIHISPIPELLPGLAIPKEPNVDGRRGFPTIDLASPVEARPTNRRRACSPIDIRKLSQN